MKKKKKKKKINPLNRGKLLKTIIIYVILQTFVICCVLDSVLCVMPATEQDTQKITGVVTNIEYPYSFHRGGAPNVYLTVNGEKYVLSWLIPNRREYKEIIEPIKTENKVTVMVVEDKSFIPSFRKDMKSIVDIRSDTKVYCDIEEMNRGRMSSMITVLGFGLFVSLIFTIFAGGYAYLLIKT